MESAIPWMRREVGEVFLRELDEGRLHGGRALHGFAGEGIGFVLMAAREEIPQRREKRRETGKQREEKEQARGGRASGGGARVRREAKGLVERRPTQRQRGEEE